MERKYLLSSDIIGVAGPPWHMQDIAGSARKDPSFDGIEQIAWHTALVWQTFLENAGFKVKGKHGRLGGTLESRGIGDKIKVFGANNLLQTEEHLFSSFKYGKHLEYVLLHGPKAGNDNTRRLIREYARDPRFFLFIENHSKKGGFGEAIEFVQEVRSDGIENVGFMFDLVHYVLPNLGTNSFDTMWKRAMHKLSELRNLKDEYDKPIKIGMHIPIGINGLDSLPLGQMKHWHWELLAEKIEGWEGLTIVYENQHDNFVVLSRSERLDESKRLEDVLGDQKRYKIIGANAS